MTTTDIVDGEIIEEMTSSEAERITEQIKIKLDSATRAWSSLAELVADAYSRGAHRALGYETWEAYVSEKFSDAGHGLPVPIRQELVAVLSHEGLSTRAIAPVVGVSQKQVVKDTQREVIPRVSPATEAEVSAPPCSIVGRDGKTYPRPVKKPSESAAEVIANRPAAKPKRKRKPITAQFGEAADDLDRLANRLTKLAKDDRFNANRGRLAGYAKRLRMAAEELLKVADLLDPPNDERPA